MPESYIAPRSRALRRSRFLAGMAALAGAASAPRIAAEPVPQARIELGNAVFLRETWGELYGRSIGIITNQSGVTSDVESVVDAIERHGSIRLKAIYAPEHGFRGDRNAGAAIGSYTDPQTHLPVYGLYGASRHPSAAMLDGVDVIAFDIQDVGSRAYTYISTMAYAMQSAKAFGKEFWVFDRPNPIGGTVEGPVLEPRYASFIGLYPIAMRHGMTVGELAMLFNDRFGIGARLKVVRMRGWHHDMIWPDTGLQWVQTSPNIPDWQTTVVYPGTGLLDSMGVNNGSGWTKPFFLAGALGLDATRLADRLNARNIPGVWFRPIWWSPLAGFWRDRELSGVELMVFDPRRFLAVRSAVEILAAVRELFPHVLTLDRAAEIDRDWGTDAARAALLEGRNAADIVGMWSGGLERFAALRERYLLYA